MSLRRIYAADIIRINIYYTMHVLFTGTEALFANLGYFSIRSIQVCAKMLSCRYTVT